MSNRLKGKRAFVTAAAAGIGRACAIAFAREGAQVVATDVDEKGLATLKGEGITEAVKLDVRDTAAVEAMAKRVGKVDILLNAAGFVHHGTIFDCSEADWDFSFDLNVKSMHRTIRAFLPAMLEGGGGSIVNIASAAGAIKAAPNRYVYSATKAAVAVLSDSLRKETQGRIKVTVVRPTGVLGTGLGSGVINPEAVTGITGAKAPAYLDKVMAALTGELDGSAVDADSPEFWAIGPETIAAEVIHAIDQPWGVVISDVTVRATGEDYLV